MISIDADYLGQNQARSYGGNTQTGKFVFCAQKTFFTVRSACVEQLPPPSPPHRKWDIFKYIFQILRASLVVVRMAVFLRAEDLQRALHTFQSGAIPPNEKADTMLLSLAGLQIFYLPFSSTRFFLPLPR